MESINANLPIVEQQRFYGSVLHEPVSSLWYIFYDENAQNDNGIFLNYKEFSVSVWIESEMFGMFYVLPQHTYKDTELNIFSYDRRNKCGRDPSGPLCLITAYQPLPWELCYYINKNSFPLFKLVCGYEVCTPNL